MGSARRRFKILGFSSSVASRHCASRANRVALGSARNTGALSGVTFTACSSNFTRSVPSNGLHPIERQTSMQRSAREGSTKAKDWLLSLINEPSMLAPSNSAHSCWSAIKAVAGVCRLPSVQGIRARSRITLARLSAIRVYIGATSSRAKGSTSRNRRAPSIGSGPSSTASASRANCPGTWLMIHLFQSESWSTRSRSTGTSKWAWIKNRRPVVSPVGKWLNTVVGLSFHSGFRFGSVVRPTINSVLSVRPAGRGGPSQFNTS